MYYYVKAAGLFSHWLFTRLWIALILVLRESDS